MRVRTLLVALGILGVFACGVAAPQQPTIPPPPQTDAEKAALLDRVLANQKKSDAAMNVYERVERVETRKNASDPVSESKTSRVVPAGTGTDHIPIGPDGRPADPAAYHAELVKLEKALSWAVGDGHAQHDAYDKVAKKQKERQELIEATRTAFLYTLVGTEMRAGRLLNKYRMEPNPDFKPTSRSSAIFAKVEGFVWIDPAAGELARIEGEVTGDINVGLFLAKIYKGSHFMQERYEMAPDLWMPTFSQYDFDGRKFFSSISIHERTFYTQYRRIGPPREALASIRAELGRGESGKSAPPASDP